MISVQTILYMACFSYHFIMFWSKRKKKISRYSGGIQMHVSFYGWVDFLGYPSKNYIFQVPPFKTFIFSPSFLKLTQRFKSNESILIPIYTSKPAKSRQVHVWCLLNSLLYWFLQVDPPLKKKIKYPSGTSLMLSQLDNLILYGTMWNTLTKNYALKSLLPANLPCLNPNVLK